MQLSFRITSAKTELLKLRAPVLTKPSQTHTHTPFLQINVRASRSGETKSNGKRSGQSTQQGTLCVPRAPTAGKPSSHSRQTQLPQRYQRLPPPYRQESAARHTHGEKGGGLLLRFSRQRRSREPKIELKRFLPTLSNAALLREKSRFLSVPVPLPGKRQGALPALLSHAADALRAISTTKRKHCT